MSIKTYSAFNYGHTITIDNQYINFNEGAGELSATMNIGGYDLADFTNEISRAMNEVALVQEYTATLDRTTRMITISASSNFDLLIDSGSQKEISAFSLMGFTGADLTGAITFTADSVTGQQYEPQFVLQNFIDFENDQKAANSTVNESASGQVEVVSYGKVKTMTCDFSFITDITPQVVIKNNPTGLLDARSFMEYATTKAPVEFIADIDNPNTVVSCLLESAGSDKKGTGFVLKELYAKGLAEYFEIRTIKFRQL